MSLCHVSRNRRSIPVGLLLLFVAGLMSVAASAQQQDNPPKADIFVGYQWLHPGGNIPVVPNTTGTAFFQSAKLPDMAQGFGAAAAYNFHPNLGLELDFGGDFKSPAMSVYTVSVGPRVMWRTEGMNIFAHALGGLNRLDVPGVGNHNGLGAILGGGFDIPVNHSFSIRLLEADYQLGHQRFDVVGPVQPELRRQTFSGARLRTGLVFGFGGGPGTPPSASCSAQPSEVMVGEPVTVTATGKDFNPKHTLNYKWASTGGKVTSKDNSASIDTNGLAGGSYTATARVSDPKVKKGGEASCTATFTVKEPPKNPPTMSCTANPSTVQAGGTATITCDCKSPDNQSVSVAGWNATGGNVSGNGNTASLNTTGAPSGNITVTATCTDARGLTTTSNAQVAVENPPPPPPPPAASKLSECSFPNKVKPWRVDNTCKAVLDDVAQALKNQPDARVVAVGFADPAELKKRKNLAGERAVNSKAYLSGGEAKQAIDPSRIEVRTGSGGGQKTEYWIVPAGATYNQPDTQPVNESKVKAIPDHPRAAPTKKAKKAQ